jgi:hypothetical protein
VNGERGEARTELVIALLAFIFGCVGLVLLEVTGLF